MASSEGSDSRRKLLEQGKAFQEKHRMTRKAILAFILLNAICQTTFSGPASTQEPVAASPNVSRQDEEPEEVKSARDAERKWKNREDFNALVQMDSVAWLKTRAFKRPDEPMDQLEKERVQRKSAAIREFCQEGRFQKQAEVDSIPSMKAEDRRFCKDRLRLVNPLIP